MCQPPGGTLAFSAALPIILFTRHVALEDRPCVPHPCAPSAAGVGAHCASTVSVTSSMTSLCSRVSLRGLGPLGSGVQGLLSSAEVWLSALGTDGHIPEQNTRTSPLLQPRTLAEEQDRTENGTGTQNVLEGAPGGRVEQTLEES